MGHDDRYDDLIASLAGFHRSWLVYLGLELGLFERVRAAGREGITTDALAAETGTQPAAIEAWAAAADAHDLATFEDGHLVMDDDVAAILLDGDRADFLGGQFVHAVVAAMDWGDMETFFRTGTPIAERPSRYREAIEILTRQDIAVFFQEALAALPQLVADLSRGGRVVDVHCGGGRWLVAMARRFPALELGYRCLSEGADAGCVLNAADEVAVEAFLQSRIAFDDMQRINRAVLDRRRGLSGSIEELLEADRLARVDAHDEIRATAIS